MVDLSVSVLDPEFVLSVVTDPGRLAELADTGLLDTGAEEPFDRITRLAEQLLGVDSARVTLVDRDRQYFKSRSDAGPDELLGETPLSHSFCKYAVASRHRFVVEDARQHPQVRENPAIVDHGVVAYAGETLETASGHVLGTLCVVSKEPREWTNTELDLLGELAHLALTEIEYRLRSRALARLADAVADLHAPAAELSDVVLRLVAEAEQADQPVVGRLAVAARSKLQKMRSVVGDLEGLIQWRPDVLENVHQPSVLGDHLMRAARAASASVVDRPLRTDIRDRISRVRCDPLALQGALTNLLVAAMQHAAADVPVEVAVHRNGDDVELRLDSDGRAMPVSELARLVGQLHAALTEMDSSTVGASLQVSERVTRIGHGPITATTGPGGTFVSFSVPFVPEPDDWLLDFYKDADASELEALSLTTPPALVQPDHDDDCGPVTDSGRPAIPEIAPLVSFTEPVTPRDQTFDSEDGPSGPEAEIFLRILGLFPGASWQDTRGAHAELIEGHRSDLFADKAQAEMVEASRREVNSAYAALRSLTVGRAPSLAADCAELASFSGRTTPRRPTAPTAASSPIVFLGR